MIRTIWHSGVPEGHFLLLWTRQEKLSKWYRNIGSLEKAAEKLSKKQDCYLGVGSSPENFGPKARCPSEKITYIPGIVADLDIANPTRKNTKGLFKNEKEITEFIKSLPHQPTLEIFSGGGVQCWWIFKEPFEIESETDRNQIEGLSYGWHELLKSKANGNVIDSVWDLARIMRFSGTLNHKSAPPQPVEVRKERKLFFNLDELEEWCPTLEPPGKKLSTVQLEEIDYDAQPNFDKFQTLYSLDTKFRLSWERKRTDMGSASASEYDLSIANIAAFNGWEEEEIFSLLVAHRRYHGDGLKRKDYYERTIEKAFDFTRSEGVARKIEDDPAEVEKSDIISMIRKRTGVQLTKIIRHGDISDGIYSVVIEENPDRLIGVVEKVLRWPTWHGIAFETGGKMVPRPSPKVWAEVLRGIQQIVEVQESEDTKEDVIVKGWVRDHVMNSVDLSSADKTEKGEHFESELPYEEDGYWYLSLSKFLQDIRLTRVRGMTHPELARLLKNCGFESMKIQAWINGRNSGRRYWRIRKGEVE